VIATGLASTLLLSVDTVLVALLGLLVVGLLRSHAEVLRRLDPEDRSDPGLPSQPSAFAVPAPPARPAPLASDIVGMTPAGDARSIALTGHHPSRPSTLIAFLSTGCTSCQGLWRELAVAGRSMPGDARLVVVAKDPDRESPGRLVELVPGDVAAVMSSAAWNDYDVPASPYFVLVDGATGEVRGEGTATEWTQVRSLVADAIADEMAASGMRGAAEPDSAPRSTRGIDRLRRADGELASAGIGPDHPSLYPAPTRTDHNGEAGER